MIHPLSVPWPPPVQVQPSSISYMDNLRSLRAPLSCSCVQYQPIPHIDIVSNFLDFVTFISKRKTEGCLAHSLLHRILLSCWYKFNHQHLLLGHLWRTLRNHFHAPACIPADFFCIDIVSEYNSLASSHSATKS